jgi:anion-transporting  ArsA/GET3 family ATPase
MSAAVEAMLAGRAICICAGAGGVGKTTTAAAVAAGMAARGLKVAVLTIDPARRLADSLGLSELGNEPARVDPSLFDAAGVKPGGELWAMMLDAKATFDEVVRNHAPDEETRERILNNRIYREISNALAGSQEYMAMEKLYEIDERGEFDLLVLDTPPTRNALDFLDAPRRLTQFIEGRSLQLFLRPSGLGMRMLGRGTSVVFGMLRRVTGLDLIEDLREFFGAMSGMVGGFRERAERVSELLGDPRTGFLVVCGPAGAPLEEAVYFHRKLDQTGMQFAGVIVNRVHRLGLDGDPDRDLPERLEAILGDAGLARRVSDNLADLRALAERDEANVAGLRRELAGIPVLEVPELSEDVHDLAGLFGLCAHLFAEPMPQT